MDPVPPPLLPPTMGVGMSPRARLRPGGRRYNEKARTATSRASAPKPRFSGRISPLPRRQLYVTAKKMYFTKRTRLPPSLYKIKHSRLGGALSCDPVFRAAHDGLAAGGVVAGGEVG